MPHQYCLDCVEEIYACVKCYYCDAVLCRSCEWKHRIDIKLCIKHSEKEKERKKARNCQHHKKEPLTHSCSQCNEKICKTCHKQKHKDHDTELLKDTAERQISEFMEKVNYLSDKQLPKLERSNELLKEDTENYKKDMDNLEKRFCEEKKKFLAESEEVCQRVLSKLTKQKKEDMDILNTQQILIKRRIKETEDLIKVSILNRRNMDWLDMLVFIDKTSTRLQELQANCNHATVRAPQDVSACLDQNQVLHMARRLSLCGKEDVPCPNEKLPSGIHATKIKSLQTDIENVDSVCPYIGSTAWISGVEKNLVILIQEGNVQESLRLETVFKVHELAVSVKQDDIVMIPFDERQIGLYKMTQSGVLSKFWEMIPYQTTCVSFANNGDLLVGLGNEQEGSKIVRLRCVSGTVIQEIAFKDPSTRLYEYPYRVIQNKNGDIVVIDYCKRAVIAVNEEGNFHFEYKGLDVPEKYREYDFDPRGITNDRLGNILVADYINDCIHLLSPDGNFLQILLSKENGISYPRSIALSESSKLWIGQRDGKIQIFSYHLQN